MPNREKQLSPIDINTRPQVLILGNGINRSFGNSSWNSVLEDMSSTSFEEEYQIMIDELPFPLQAIIVTGDNVDEGARSISARLTSEAINPEHAKIIRNYTDLGFDAILTTNYTYEIEKSLNGEFYCNPEKSCKYREKTCVAKKAEDQFCLYSYMHVNDNNIWHIHGEAARPKSVVIGHYYYGKLLQIIQNYIPRFWSRYKYAEKYNRAYEPTSWIDYILLGDIYIVGLGLDPSEMDLWWLINCKKRHEKELSGGRVFWFEPNLSEHKNFARRVLAETNGMTIKTQRVKKLGYRRYYSELYKEIEGIIQGVE